MKPVCLSLVAFLLIGSTFAATSSNSTFNSFEFSGSEAKRAYESLQLSEAEDRADFSKVKTGPNITCHKMQSGARQDPVTKKWIPYSESDPQSYYCRTRPMDQFGESTYNSDKIKEKKDSCHEKNAITDLKRTTKEVLKEIPGNSKSSDATNAVAK